MYPQGRPYGIEEVERILAADRRRANSDIFMRWLEETWVQLRLESRNRT